MWNDQPKGNLSASPKCAAESVKKQTSKATQPTSN